MECWKDGMMETHISNIPFFFVSDQSAEARCKWLEMEYPKTKSPPSSTIAIGTTAGGGGEKGTRNPLFCHILKHSQKLTQPLLNLLIYLIFINNTY
jgi:hypothetical protein